MFCKHCSAAINSDAKFCSYCGCEVLKSPQPQAAAASNAGKFWIKLLISCIVVVAAFSLFVAMLATDPADTIEDQLKSLRKEHFTEAYYNYTSKTFQETVSLDNFRNFIAKYPFFTSNGTLKVINEKIESNMGTIDAVISSTLGGESPVQYRMVKEGDKWKILSIKFEDNEAGKAKLSMNKYRSTRDDIAEALNVEKGAGDKELFDPSPLYTVIQKQVSDVKAGNIDKSYKDYSSNDFRKTTTFDVFSKFIKSHPGFVDNKTIEFEKISVENNVVTLSGTLTSKNNHVYPFTYSLVFEDGAWKVLHIEVFAEKGAKINSVVMPVGDKAMTFEKFSLGTVVNSEGLITDPKLTFMPGSGQIHLNLFLKNAIAGTEVQVEFSHVESGSKAPLASAKVPENGDMILSFAFTPPVNGWPKGNYRIDAKSSTNAEGNVAFKVE